MVETISPVVHGGKTPSYWRSVALHALGATASAALVGAALGGLGALLGAPWGNAGLMVLAAVAAVYALRELFDLPIPIPDMDRQVPDWWRTFYSREVAALLYGVGLGVGFLTYVSFGTLVVVAAAAITSGSPFAAAFALSLFGLARGLSILISADKNPERTVEELGEQRLRQKVRLINGLTMMSILGATAFSF